MLKELTGRLLGYVTFLVSGGDFGRFLTLCAKSGIRIWGIAAREDGRECRVGCHAYPLLHSLRKKAGVSLRITGKHGLRFLLRPFFRRRGLILGTALFVATVLFLNAHIWIVGAQGTESIPENEILAAAESLGLSKGMLKSRLDSALMRQELMLALPKASWVSVNTLGASVTIVVKEKTGKPEITDLQTPTEVYAAFTGQILEMETFGGTALVAVGDAVREGQLLVSSRIEDETGNLIALDHASGKIIARVRLVIQAQIPKEETLRVQIGSPVCRASMRLFGVEFPLSLRGAPQGDYIRTVSRFPFRIGETELPIEVTREEWYPTQEQTCPIDSAKARSRAREQIEAALAAACPEAQIERSSFSFSDNDEGTSAQGIFILITDIAAERPADGNPGEIGEKIVEKS